MCQFKVCKTKNICKRGVSGAQENKRYDITPKESGNSGQTLENED